MTKEELMNILRMFEYETCSKRMRIVQFHDTYVVCLFEELVMCRSPFDPADIDVDVDVFTEKVNLLDIANSIDEMPSAYWHTVAEDIRLWCDIHYTQQQLVKVQQDIKDINADLDKGDLEEDEIRQLCNALNQLFGLEDNLKWELDVLINK